MAPLHRELLGIDPFSAEGVARAAELLSELLRLLNRGSSAELAAEGGGFDPPYELCGGQTSPSITRIAAGWANVLVCPPHQSQNPRWVMFQPRSLRGCICSNVRV